MSAPGYWMNETSGVLRPAIGAYLNDGDLSDSHIALLRGYLRQWIGSSHWVGEEVDGLRLAVDGLTSRTAIRAWLERADAIGIDPL